MDWTTVIKVATGVTTAGGLFSISMSFYVWFASQKRERSLREVIEGEKIATPAQIDAILKAFTTDAPRLDALNSILNSDDQKSRRIIRKIKAHFDVSAFSKGQSKRSTIRLVVVGSTLLIMALSGGTFLAFQRAESVHGNAGRESSVNEPTKRMVRGRIYLFGPASHEWEHHDGRTVVVRFDPPFKEAPRLRLLGEVVNAEGRRIQAVIKLKDGQPVVSPEQFEVEFSVGTSGFPPEALQPYVEYEATERPI